MTTRSLYQPHEAHTVCGSLAAAQRGQMLRDGALRRHDPARWLWVFIFDFFFLGTATRGLPYLNEPGKVNSEFHFSSRSERS